MARDKMLSWLGRDFYGAPVNAKVLGDRETGRVGQLSRFVEQHVSDTPEREAVYAFISICCELDELRDYRDDDDLHGVSPRIIEALGREDRDLDMPSLWEFMIRELHCCAEAFVMCLQSFWPTAAMRREA